MNTVQMFENQVIINVPAMFAHPGTRSNLYRRLDMSILAPKQMGRGRSIVICERCGCEFRIKNSVFRRGRNVRFCSLECRYARVTRICEVCENEFEMKPSHAAIKGIGRYCSLECRSAGYIKRGVFAGENSPRYIDGKSQTREYICMKAHQRRLRLAENGGSYTLQEWKDLCAKYNNRCLCCRRDDLLLTVDHVIPLIDGGSNDISNIQPLCKSCNSRKNTKRTDYRPHWVDMTSGEPELMNS